MSTSITIPTDVKSALESMSISDKGMSLVYSTRRSARGVQSTTKARMIVMLTVRVDSSLWFSSREDSLFCMTWAEFQNSTMTVKYTHMYSFKNIKPY